MCKERVCKNCHKKLDISYFYKRKDKRNSKFYITYICKKCLSIINNAKRKADRANGIPYWSEERNKTRRLKRRINKCKQLNMTQEQYNIYLTTKKNINNKKNYLSKITKRLNKYKPSIFQYYINAYQISKDDWLELTKDNPTKTTLIYRIRYRYDDVFNMKQRIKNQIARKRKKYPNMDYTIRKCIVENNNSNYFDYLGYKPINLKKHLESLFTEGMSWDEFKKGNIHIDHIKPQSSFNLQEDEEIKKCWSLNNLQPLWAKDNLIKSNKYNINL